MKNKENIRYIEVTEKRYYNVKTRFKYFSSNLSGERHYYLARNRLHLDDRLQSGDISSAYWEYIE